MPKRQLTGTLEEQCAFLYDLAEQKMAAGNFTGAIHALKEILKYAPAYPGAADLMARAQVGKREQRNLVFCGFAGAITAIFLGTWWGLPNDLWFLGVAVAGAVVGYLIGAVAVGNRKQSGSSTQSRL